LDYSAASLWAAFLASGLPEATAATDASYTSWHFGTGGRMADELLELVLAGHKKATAGALWSHDQEGEPTPEVGKFSVVTNGAGLARCVILTTRVDIVPFSEVDELFAAAEGEGDLSLDHWRQGHWKYFSRELAPYGLTPWLDMPVVCEHFEVVYPSEASHRGTPGPPATTAGGADG